jgi:hypothetical protein
MIGKRMARIVGLSLHLVAWIEARHGSQFFKQGALVCGQGGRDDDRHPDVLIAAPAVPAPQALTPQAQPPSARRARRDGHVYGAVERRDPDGGAEGSFPGCHRQLELHVTLAQDAEQRMRTKPHVHQKITGRRAAYPVFPLAGQA